MAADSQGTRGEFMTAPVTNRRFIHNLQAGIYSFTMVALSEHLPSEVVGPIPVIIKAVPGKLGSLFDIVISMQQTLHVPFFI